MFSAASSLVPHTSVPVEDRRTGKIEQTFISSSTKRLRYRYFAWHWLWYFTISNHPPFPVCRLSIAPFVTNSNITAPLEQNAPTDYIEVRTRMMISFGGNEIRQDRSRVLGHTLSGIPVGDRSSSQPPVPSHTYLWKYIEASNSRNGSPARKARTAVMEASNNSLLPAETTSVREHRATVRRWH